MSDTICRGLPLLDAAQANGVSVALGLAMAPERHGFDYDDRQAVAAQFVLQKRQAVAVGQPQIEKDDVEGAVAERHGQAVAADRRAKSLCSRQRRTILRSTASRSARASRTARVS